MSVPSGAATASAGVVRPTVSSPTMPMTPTENEVAVTRLNDAPRLRRGATCSAAASSTASAAASASDSASCSAADWIGRLAREGEEPGGGLERVDLGGCGPGCRIPNVIERLGDDVRFRHLDEDLLGSILDLGLEQFEGLGGDLHGIEHRRRRGTRGRMPPTGARDGGLRDDGLLGGPTGTATATGGDR